MKFELNGELKETVEPLSVHELLERFELQQRRVAVAINTEVVPRSRFESVEVREGDRVEVIHAVGGG
jgi:sulfur carrier protein